MLLSLLSIVLSPPGYYFFTFYLKSGDSQEVVFCISEVIDERGWRGFVDADNCQSFEAAAFKQNSLRVEKEEFATATGINPGKSSEQRKTSKNAAVLFRPFLCHFSGGPGNQQKAKLNWQLAATRRAKWPFFLYFFVFFCKRGIYNKPN